MPGDLSGLKIRQMTLDDLEQVIAIDQISFSLPWPARSFQFELTDNPASRCWGLGERFFPLVEARRHGAHFRHEVLGRLSGFFQTGDLIRADIATVAQSFDIEQRLAMLLVDDLEGAEVHARPAGAEGGFHRR